MKKKYFAIACNTRNLVIVSLDAIPRGYEKAYTELTEEQLQYLEEHPAAEPEEVKNCGKGVETDIIQDESADIPEVSIENYKAAMLDNMSHTSLLFSRKKVDDYQFLNAQASLLLEDGLGIYSHEESNRIIQEYVAIGKLCRDKYYEFEKELEALEDRESIDTLINSTLKWYESL